MQYVQVPVGTEQIFFVESARADDMKVRIDERIAAQVLEDTSPYLSSLELAGGGSGHTFVAKLGFVPATLGALLEGSVRTYLAADAENLALHRAAAIAGVSGTIVDDLIAGAKQGTRFMGITVFGTATSEDTIPVDLGAVSTFAILAATPDVTSANLTTVTGDVGITPAAAVNGPFTYNTPGNPHLNDAAAIAAKAALITAYLDLVGRTVPTPVVLAANLNGATLSPGIHDSVAAVLVTGAGLTLDAGGDPNAVFILRVASSLTVGAGVSVLLAGGAQAKNVFWTMGASASLNTGGVFNGNILALTSITVASARVINGRLLARNGTVTVDANVVTVPT